MRGDYDWAIEYLGDAIGNAWRYDDWGQGKLDVALYTEGFGLSSEVSHAAYYDFLDYMMETYGYDFEEEFDWDAYREWYNSQ